MRTAYFSKKIHYALCFSTAVFAMPTFSHATAKPINFNCTAANPEEVMPVMALLNQTTVKDMLQDPIAMLISVALNQKYQRDFGITDIQRLRENSSYELAFPFRSDFVEIRKVIQKMGYDATGFRFMGAAVGVQQGDVGFLLDTHVHFDRTPVIALLVSVTSDKRHVLYGDGTVCPMEKQQFEQRFADSKYLRLDEKFSLIREESHENIRPS